MLPKNNKDSRLPRRNAQFADESSQLQQPLIASAADGQGPAGQQTTTNWPSDKLHTVLTLLCESMRGVDSGQTADTRDVA